MLLFFPAEKCVQPLYIHYQIENKVEHYYFDPYPMGEKYLNYFHHPSNLTWLALMKIKVQLQ